MLTYSQYLVAAGGGGDAQDGGSHAQVGVLVGVQEAIQVVRLRRRDHPRQKALLPLCPRPVRLRLGRLLTDGLHKVHAIKEVAGSSCHPLRFSLLNQDRGFSVTLSE